MYSEVWKNAPKRLQGRGVRVEVQGKQMGLKVNEELGESSAGTVLLTEACGPELRFPAPV